MLDVTTAQYGLQEVLQFTAGAKVQLPHNLELTVDGYVNPVLRSLEVDVGGGRQPPIDTTDPNRPRAFPISERSGVAYGLEAMLRFPQQGHFFGWLTASLSRSQRRTLFPRENGTLVSADLPWTFDQTFIANAVGSYRFDNGWSLGLTVHFNTGRPEDGSLGGRTEVRNAMGVWTPVDQDKVDRLPPFFRLDFRASKTWLTKSYQLELYLDVLNVLVRQEVVGFTYGETKEAIGLPVIVPMLGFKGRY